MSHEAVLGDGDQSAFAEPVLHLKGHIAAHGASLLHCVRCVCPRECVCTQEV